MISAHWSSWSDFLAMGGYGLFVWGSFGVTALVMAGEILSLRLRRRALTDDVDEENPS
jgi:heme exporter protein D